MIHERDILFLGGGLAWKRYGRLYRVVEIPRRNGEEAKGTFSRTGIATMVGRDGLLSTVESNQPRPSYFDINNDGTQELGPCLLLEPARTNVYLWSHDFSNAVWVKSALAVSADPFVGPDNKTTAWKLTEDSTTGQHIIRNSNPAATDNKNQTVSFFVRQGSRTWCYIESEAKDGTFPISWFNLATGTWGTIGHTRVYSRPMANGYYRIEVTWNAKSGASPLNVWLGMSTGDTVTSYAGDGSSFMHAVGGQFEVDGPYATSYIKTGAAIAIRNAESLAFASYLPPQACSIYLKFVESGLSLESLASGGFDRLIQLGSGSGGTQRWLNVRTSGATGKYEFSHETNGGAPAVFSNVSGLPTFGAITELLATCYADGSVQIQQSTNGGAPDIGARSGSNAFTVTWASPTLNLPGGAAGAINLLSAIVARGNYSLVDFQAVMS